MMHRIPAEYRLPFWGGLDLALRRSLTASSTLGVLLVLLVLLTPARETKLIEVSQVPERFARLILEKPKPPARAARPERPAGTGVEPARPEPVTPSPPPAPPAARPPTRRQTTPAPTPGTGAAGRRMAEQKVTASLAGATQSADAAVKSLTAVLGAKPTSSSPRPGRRRASVGSARGSGDLAAVGGGATGVTGKADLAGSGVSSSGGVHIEEVTWAAGSGSGSGEPGSAGAAGGSSGGSATLSERTQASLLAVVRRYAPGIQFCYDNELKHSPGLRGKLVAAITVTAAGKVQDARIVTDTLKSADLASCVRSQILDWKFPAVPEGTVTFDAPFVFTPPRS